MHRLELLGPVTLRRNGQTVPLPTHKVAALLVMLALGGPAHRARVAAWLWPAVDDAAARRNLRRELARLREAGIEGLLFSEGAVLRLADEPMLTCDAWTFRSAAVSSCDTQAQAALALWRGPPADGLALDGTEVFSDWLQAEREHLHALRRRALQATAATHESRGEFDAALARIETLLAEDPLQEHLHREAMRLHLAGGRREAALAQYQRCCQLLQQELGLAPMAATEALAEQARQAAVAPELPSTVATPSVWQGVLPLTGRDDAWAALQSAWDARRLLLIEGDAGAGKTRLGGDFAAAQGAYALAQCRSGDADTPYAAFKRALRLLAGPAIANAGLPPWVTAELAHVLPELGTPSTRTATAEDRSRLHEAAVVAWHTLAADSFDSVVIDDWHLADADSRSLLTTIARAPWPGPGVAPRLLWLLRPELDDDARATLHTLTAAGALHLRLAPLNAAQLLELVRQVSGAAEAQRFTVRLLQATGGNPFFITETLHHWQALGLLALRDDGIWRTPFDDDTVDYRELPVPASVREAVLARVQRQPAAARRLLEAAALAAEPFSPAWLAGACALSELEALDAIEPALAAGLLRELGGGYAFAHDLVQAAVEGTLSPERRRLVHRRLALGAEAAGLEPAEIARHWEAGGDPRRAVPHRLAAASAALALASWDSAEAHWRIALADDPDPGQQVALLRQRWPTLQVRDDREGLQAVHDELARLHARWSQHPDSAHAALEARTEQALLLSLGLGLHSDTTALALADAVLPALDSHDPLRVRVQLARAQALNVEARHAEAEQAVEDALSCPGPGLTPRMQAQLLHTLAYSFYSRGQPQRALTYAERTLLVWQAAGERRLTVRALANIGLMQSAIGDQAQAAQALEQARAVAAELRMVEVHREICNNLADIMLCYGDADQALALADEALGLSPQWARPSFQVFLRGMKVQAYWQQGRLGEALETAEQALVLACQSDRVDTLVDCVSMALDVYAFVADWSGADRLLAHLAAREGARSSHFEVKLCFNRVRLALWRGDLQAAGAALAGVPEVSQLHEGRDRAHAVLCHAELAQAMGDAAAALRWLDDCPAPGAHVEVAARCAVVRLQALLALRSAGQRTVVDGAVRDGKETDRRDDAGGRTDGLAEAMQAAMTAAEHARSPRPSVLALRQVLAVAAGVAGDAAAQAAHRAAGDALLAAMAHSLDRHPSQRAGLLGQWT